jgi:predicted SAM-dependent methyltransferase
MKLHLGCGKRFIPDFIHIDVVAYDHIDYINNIDDLSMFSDKSVSLIYNCHVLEHFHRKKINRVLKEWFRVLKPGGILRTAVPDFEALCKLYQDTKNLSLIVGPVFGRQDYLYNIHYSMYDFATIRDLLIEAGFDEVRKYDWRQTEHSNIDDYSQSYYPHMDKEKGMLLSLNVEAVK